MLIRTLRNLPLQISQLDVEFYFAGANGSSGKLVDAGDAPGTEIVLYPNTDAPLANAELPADADAAVELPDVDKLRRALR